MPPGFRQRSNPISATPKIVVITPFNRPEYFARLRDVLCPEAVEWHLILSHNPAPEPLPYWCRAHWITPRNSEPFDWCYHKLQWFADSIGYDACKRYGVLCDDDSVEPGYFNKIRRAGCCPVVVTSRDWGDRYGHHLATPEGFMQGHCGFQFWVMGDILRYHHWRQDTHGGDSEMGRELVRRHKTAYLPDAWGYYNGLSSGRQFGPRPGRP